MKPTSVLTVIFVLLAITSAVVPDPKVLEDSERDQFASFSIHLKSKADLSGASRVLDSDKRGWFVYNTLSAHARATQAPIIELLEARTDVKRITPYFIANFIIVEAKRSVIELLTKRNDIKAINSNRPFKVNLEEPDTVQTPRVGKAPEWNINYVKAPIVWEKYGIDGTGSIYANADTGVDYTHPALNGNYKGTSSNGTYNHNYNWWDGIKTASIPGTGRCGINSQVPCDDNSHGTHTTGTSVGLDGIGVAPGARWIACRNMDRGYGTPESYISCLQFFLAPTDLQGANPNPSVRPHAIGNSYGCVTSEGCNGDEFGESVEALREAGVFMSVSAGNSGPSCSTIGDPPATELLVISVGATAYNSDSVASYSSRGPVSGQKRPNIAAPGSSVRSCVPGGGYSSFSGTSMASPHLGAGVVLLNQICPGFIYNVDAYQTLFESSARTLYTTQGCGGDTSSTTPNNVFGHGMLDLEAAAAECVSKHASLKRA